MMKSSIVKRSVVIAGHKTSVSLEDAFWASVREIAKVQGQTLSQLIGSIDSDRQYGGNGNLSSAIRLFVLGFYLNQPAPQSGTRERFAA
jgi:predicted DNA-binding ribbon-helix-helix protein